MEDWIKNKEAEWRRFMLGKSINHLRFIQVNDWHGANQNGKFLVDGVIEFHTSNNEVFSFGWHAYLELIYLAPVSFEELLEELEDLEYAEIQPPVPEIFPATISKVDWKHGAFEYLGDNGEFKEDCTPYDMVIHFDNGHFLHLASVFAEAADLNEDGTIEYDAQGEILVSFDEVMEIEHLSEEDWEEEE